MPYNHLIFGMSTQFNCAASLGQSYCHVNLLRSFSLNICNVNQSPVLQAWVFVNWACCEAVVSFRGTEQAKWKDIVSDLNLVPTVLDAERTGLMTMGGIPLPFASFKKGKPLEWNYILDIEQNRMERYTGISPIY
jgi:hypothetical protein